MSTWQLRSAGPGTERMERSPLAAFRDLDTIAGVEKAIRTVEQRIDAQGRERKHALAALEVETERDERTTLKGRASAMGDSIDCDGKLLEALHHRLRLLRENESIVARGGVPIKLPEIAR